MINKYFSRGLKRLENLEVSEGKKKILRDYTLKLIDRIT
jgi:hypothetical protein